MDILSRMVNGRRPRICFVAHFAYGALSGTNTGHIGGVERQIAILARWFAGQGYPVSVLTWDHGHPDGKPIEGVKIFNICPLDKGVRGVRFFHPRWTGLIRAMARADADIYYQNSGECVTGQVALWCRIRGRRFIYSVSNDIDVDPALPELKTFRERLLYQYGLRQADRIIAQSKYQQQQLQLHWGIDSVVVPGPCRFHEIVPFIPRKPPNPKNARILWIGRFAEQKRLDWLLEIARLCPDLTFDVVGHANQETPYAKDFEDQARTLPNMKLHGFVPMEKIHTYYQNAAMLLCTSGFEGFPNIFLEAWGLGLPVVSSFDPDDLIDQHDIGRSATDIPGLIAAIRELLDCPERWVAISQNARDYYCRNHTVEASMPRFEKVFLSV